MWWDIYELDWLHTISERNLHCIAPRYKREARVNPESIKEDRTAEILSFEACLFIIVSVQWELVWRTLILYLYHGISLDLSQLLCA